MTEITATIAPPGSPEAVKLGCTCPILDNAHGRGARATIGTLYWISADCPIHREVEVITAWSEYLTGEVTP